MTLSENQSTDEYHPIVDKLNDDILEKEDSMYHNEDYRHNRDITKYGSVVLGFLKNLKPNTDLHSVIAPTFLLKPRSMLELGATALRPNDSLLKVHKEKDPVQRMLLVCKYIMTPATDIPSVGKKAGKPYNPILGEEFHCTFEHEDSTTHVIGEQVSHHPPVSAVYMHNKKCNFYLHDVFAPKPVFKITKFEISFNGETYLHFLNLDERYTIKKASATGKGIFFGKSRTVVSNNLVVECVKTGLKTVVEFKDNKLEGFLRKDKEKLYKFSGCLEDTVKVTNVQLDKSSQKEEIFHDCKLQNDIQKKMAPLHKQSPYESRRVWHSVTRHLEREEFDEAGVAKSALEEHQRKIRKLRAEKKDEHKSKHFKKKDYKVNGVQIFEYIDLPTKPFTSEEEDLTKNLEDLALD